MYTGMIKHSTPNRLEGIPLGMEGVTDYLPAGVTQAWDDITNRVSSIGGSTWFGYAAIGFGALFVLGALKSLGGGRRRR